MTFLLALLLAADLASVKAEPNLERRADSAIRFAQESVGGAREAVAAGDAAKLKERLSDVEAAVLLCQEALDGTGKNARRSPKHFKQAELKLREVMRRLKALSESAGVEDRDVIDATNRKVAEVHEHLLAEIMTKK